ncbi:MAG: peptide chain release factor N(5)-glutamine methyltransferase, partial [Bacteroidales bacterium]|nr:peptide chain release factor N(5)-glutamine methyltransferase [Bacteroidales bacterium]
SELQEVYSADEIRNLLRIIFEVYLGWDLTTWLLSKQKTINQSDLLKINFAIKDLKRHRPIQHILGKADFCGMSLTVNENALIPRPETEGLVELAKSRLKSPQRILDLCTGSGCIAIALAKVFTNAEITAVDISEKALEVARQNAWNQGVEIKFMQADILSDDLAELPLFDLIVSNPPYVREQEKAEMQPNVLDYEPHLALFVPNDDPLLFYRRIAEIAVKHLVPNGLLIVEINENLGEETAKLFRAQSFETSLHNDFKGKTRFAAGRR